MKTIILTLAIVSSFLAQDIHARSLKKVKRTGITFGVRKGMAPFGIQKSKDRKGIEYEIASAIAKKLDTRFRLIYLNTIKEGEEKLLTNKIDVLLSTYRKSKRNQKKFIFTKSYGKSGKSILTRKSNKDVFSIRDLDNRYVAVTAESGSQQLLEKYVKKAKIELTRSYDNAIEMLKAGDVEAIMGERIFLKELAKKNGQLQVLDLELSNDSYHMAVNSNYKKLLKAIDNSLIKINKSSNRRIPSPLEEIYQKYGHTSGITPVLDVNAPVPSNYAKPAKLKRQNKAPTRNISSKTPKKGKRDDRIRRLLQKVEEIKRELIILQSES
jgi:ABC-type amino acid transport substrate-binding protein